MTNSSVYKWTAIDRLLNTVMTFGGNILMANLLDPSEFGLLAMVAVFTAIAQNISGCGMCDGLIHKESPTARDYSTVFTVNLVLGMVFSTIFLCCSGLVAQFFGHVELRGIMIAIGICFLFQAMCMVQETKMRKDMSFKKLAVVRLSATASALALGIILVLNGYSYWGLVSTQIFLSVFLWFYYILVSRWLPRLAFYRDSFREMFGYGIHLMLAYICNQFAQNVNTSVLGKFAPAASAGIYSQAQKLESTPFGLTEAIFNWPFFSVLSNITDAAEKIKAAVRMHAAILFVNVSTACLLFFIATPAFNTLYGSKWDAAIPVFRLLLVFGVAQSMKFYYQTVFKVYGRTKLIRNLTFAEVGLQVALLFVVYDKGVMAIALSQVIPALLAVCVHVVVYRVYVRQTFGAYFKSAFLPLILPVLTLVASWLISTTFTIYLPAWANLIAEGLIFGGIMILVNEWFKPAYYMAVRDLIINKFKSSR